MLYSLVHNLGINYVSLGRIHEVKSSQIANLSRSFNIYGTVQAVMQCPVVPFPHRLLEHKEGSKTLPPPPPQSHSVTSGTGF